MLRAGWKWLACVVCFSLASLPAWARPNPDLVAKQEEILLQLAKEGVPEAYFVLGQFYEAGALRQPDKLTKARAYYKQAAWQGNPRALYWLGHDILNQPQREKRLAGLILICASALLDYPRAQVDMVLIPRFLGIARDTLENQCQSALSQFQKGQALDCRALDCNHLAGQLPACPQCTESAAFFHQTMRHKSSHSVDRLFRQKIARLSLITPDQIQNYRLFTSHLNRNKDIGYELTMTRMKTGKQKGSDETRKKIAEASLEADLTRLKPKIEHLLQNINQHRAEDKQLSLEAVLQRIRQHPHP